MRKVIAVIVVLFLGLWFAPSAHAIIFIPALILIPIAKIVAIIIGGFAFPALGIGVVSGKVYKKPLHKVVLITVMLLVLIGIAIGIILKILNPDRPIF